MNKFLTFCFFILTSLVLKAQEVEMADTFRKEGKIYVVITVACIVLVGIFVYLLLLDRKITKLENNKKN
jgi:CcmD family protein